MRGLLMLNPDAIEERVKCPEYDVIGIGSMGCIRALPSAERVSELFELLQKHSKKLRLYTPRVPQEHLEEIKCYLRSLKPVISHPDCTLVVNDMGILLWIKRSGLKVHRVVLGATYSWSVLQNALADNMLRDESDEIKSIYQQVNNNNDLRLGFFIENGVAEIEVPNLKRTVSKLERIRNMGLAVSTFENFMLAGYSRVCTCVKIENEYAANCRCQCKEIMRLNMENLWDANSQPFPYYKERTGEEKLLFSDIYVQGNMQYRKIQEKLKAGTAAKHDGFETIMECLDF